MIVIGSLYNVINLHGVFEIVSSMVKIVIQTQNSRVSVLINRFLTGMGWLLDVLAYTVSTLLKQRKVGSGVSAIIKVAVDRFWPFDKNWQH